MNTVAKLKALVGSEAFDQVSEQLISFILEKGKFSGAYYRTWSIATIIRMGEIGIAWPSALLQLAAPRL